MVCWSAAVEAGSGEIEFRQATEPLGLIAPLTGMYGHAAAFGWVDTDPYPDLLVGTFADRPPEEYAVRGADGPSTDRLLKGGDTYNVVDDFAPEMSRTSGAVFADLDSDGDADLLLVRNGRGDSPPSVLFHNDDGALSPAGEPLPAEFLGRTPAVADFDGDGFLDLFVVEDRYGRTGGVLLHNQGDLELADVTAGSGLEEVYALGATSADLNGDGHPDVATSDRIFLGKGDMTFDEIIVDGFDWSQIGPDDDPAGVAIADYDNDGLPDLLVGQHYRSIVEEGAEVPVRLFRQTGRDGSIPAFEEVTDDVGLTPLPALAPHVALADLDNDGWLDVVASGSVGGGQAPIVFRNSGGTFEAPSGLGDPHYWVGAPVVDVDLDGRLDVLGLEWEPSLPSRLFLNATDGGHWLEISVDDQVGGVGSVVEVTDDGGALLGRREIGVASGYSSGELPVAHFGLGRQSTVDVTITTRAGETVELNDVAADAHLRWPKCGESADG